MFKLIDKNEDMVKSDWTYIQKGQILDLKNRSKCETCLTKEEENKLSKAKG